MFEYSEPILCKFHCGSVSFRFELLSDVTADVSDVSRLVARAHTRMHAHRLETVYQHCVILKQQQY